MNRLRIALLTSRSAAGLTHLLADPNRGSLWDFSLVVGSETSLDEAPLLEREGVPFELRPLRAYFAEQRQSYRNLRWREEYDDGVGELLERMKPDYILLDGYQYILTEPVLARFPGRILAIHDADLSRRLGDPPRIYAGPHAVRDAILAGEPETRSSIYMVTRDVAQGPLFLLGQPYPVAEMAAHARNCGDAAFVYEYAALHRQWMVRSSWGPMLSRALELLAGGTMQIVGDVVWIDGAPGPCRLGEGPRECHEPESLVARGIPRSCPFIG